jgi:hypothetical protein
MPIAIWDVDSILPSYRNVPELRRAVVNAYTSAIKFMMDNGMFKKRRPAVGAKGRLLVRRVFSADLTREGNKFIMLAEYYWFSCKASNEYPANTAVLEKHLGTLRRDKSTIIGTRPASKPKKPPAEPEIDPWDLDARLAKQRDPVIRHLAERHYASAVQFLLDNKLLKRKGAVVGKDGKPLLRRVTSKNLTARGAAFAAAAGKPWFGSKRAFMHPENTTVLQRLLAKQP